MSLSTNWEIDTYTSGSASAQLLTYATNPIVGDRIARFEGTTPGSGSPVGSVALFPLVPPHTKGFLHGIVRSLFRCRTEEQTHAGIYVCGSLDTMITSSGSAYTIGVDNTLRFGIRKITSGGLVSGTWTDILLTETILALDEILAFEVEWHADVENFGGAYFRVALGTALDFSDLEIVASETDTDTPLLTSFAEGIFGTVRGTSQSHVTEWDSTRLQELQ